VSGVAGTQDRAKPVDPWGRYYTPIDVARRCVAAMRIEPPRLVVEPSAGAGAFVLAVRDRWPAASIDVYEPDVAAPVWMIPRREPWQSHDLGETWAPETWEIGSTSYNGARQPDMIIGNPPYKHAEDHILRALRTVREWGTVAMLLRLGVLEGAGRHKRLWSAHPPSRVLVLPRRPAFEGPGGKVGRTDASAYAWVEWIRGHRGSFRGGWL
jgi:hypothetical protein